MDEQRAKFEAWARENGLIYESHGLLSVSSSLEAFWKAWQVATHRQQERIAELEALVQALSLDAGRYRWIRAKCTSPRVHIRINNGGLEISESIDSSIDAAIAAGKGEG